MNTQRPVKTQASKNYSKPLQNRHYRIPGDVAIENAKCRVGQKPNQGHVEHAGQKNGDEIVTATRIQCSPRLMDLQCIAPVA